MTDAIAGLKALRLHGLAVTWGERPGHALGEPPDGRRAIPGAP
ncbi:MAG TPA: hypothetical protein PLW72_14180 [Burkholderiaceae bacterium]|jgi:hypothetical protein|nr:hypothetical protein [Burkholderiaceae bacterium]HQR77566.1 hypothetical protein [Burkholderiaceae bacterium]